MRIENDDLEALRESTSRTLLPLVWLHLPLVVIVGMMRGADWMAPPPSW
jgi:methyl-accepting chemotaxis protein